MKIKSAVWAHWDDWNKSFGYTISNSNMATEGWIRLKDFEVEFDEVTKEEVTPQVVAMFKAEIQKVRAKAEVKVQELQAGLQSFLALEYVSGEVLDPPGSDDDIEDLEPL